MKYDGNEAMTIHYHTYTQALYMCKYSVMQINSHPQLHTHEELRRKVWNTMKYKMPCIKDIVTYMCKKKKKKTKTNAQNKKQKKKKTKKKKKKKETKKKH